jgi:hypothetical protein
MNACAACLTDQIDQQGLLVRPRLGRERESLEAATFPVGGHGGSSSGPLLRLRASGARVCVRLEDCASEAQATHILSVALLGSKVRPLALVAAARARSCLSDSDKR